MGALRYIQRCCQLLLTNAGASDRAGFIEAPETGPANIAPGRTTIPIANPANIPCSLSGTNLQNHKHQKKGKHQFQDKLLHR